VKEKTKIILLRILLSIGIVSIVSIIVVPILCTILPPINQKYYEIISYSILILFFVSGTLFIFLELIWKVDIDKEIKKSKKTRNKKTHNKCLREGD
jgi:hypothetical protein